MHYLAFRRNVLPRDQWTVTLAEHLVWMKEQHRLGHILLSGPTPDRSTGMYLIRAGSLDEAKEIAAGDPYTVAGHTNFEIMEWDVHQAFGFGNFDAANLISNRPAGAAGH
jgi:uncharacterized protein